VSRVTAATIILPLLVIYADTIALLGSFLTVNMFNKTSFQLYFHEVSVNVSYLDVFSSLIKSAFFGFAIGIVGSYAGFHYVKVTTGVGKAANSAVVISMILIFIIAVIA